MDKSTDIEFLKLASVHLDRFHRVGDDVYNFRCPFCGDSKKSKAKSRCYSYPKDGHMIFFCHNCGATGQIYKLINHVDPSLGNQYSLKSFINRGKPKRDNEFVYHIKKKTIDASDTEINLPAISSLPDNHISKQYLLFKRQIPKFRLDDLYYTEDFAKFIKDFAPHIEKNLMVNDPRIIIPLRNKQGDLIGVQGNSIHSDGRKYIIIQIEEETLFWNRNTIDETQTTLVFEGAYDAMFFENSIATLSSSSMEKADMKNKILVFDNEPLNRQTVEYMNKAMEHGLNVCVWNAPFDKWKDVNDMVVKGGFTTESIKDFIMNNNYNGLRLQLEINKWLKRK